MTMELFRAVDAANRGNYPNALSAFQDHLTKQPEDAWGHAQLASCLLRMGRPFAALEETQRALKANPELAMAHLAKAQVANAMDDPELSKAALAEALRIDPENTDALIIRCFTAVTERDFAGLRTAAEAVLAKKPDTLLPHYFISRAASFVMNGKEAEAYARSALAIGPDEETAHEAIGWAFWAQHDMPRAREAALSALAIDPEFQGAHALLAAIEMHSRPLTGWFHKLGMVAEQASLKTGAKYGCGAIFAYLILQNVLDHFGFDTVENNLRYGIMAVSALLLYSVHSYKKKSVANKKEARLRHDY